MDAIEKKEPAVIPPPKAKQPLRYVGPGSPGHADKTMPTIANLPLSLKSQAQGTNPQVYTADELPEKYIEYVRTTCPNTKDWWQ
jgi:hypothetical protein